MNILLGDAPADDDGGISALAARMLRQADCALREQTLDALSDPATGNATLLALWVRSSHRLAMTAPGQAADWPGGRSRAPSGPLADALQRGADGRAIAILADQACLPVEAVAQAIRLRDAGMLVALCWLGGCTAAETQAVQSRLGRIAPDQVLRVGSGPETDLRGTPDWPVPIAAMEWSIGILREMLNG